MNELMHLNHPANDAAPLADLPVTHTPAAEVRGGLTKPPETAPALRPPPPKLPPDPPPPIRA